MEQELSNAAVAVVGVTAVGSLGTWTIEKEDAVGNSRLTYHTYSEPGGAIPAFLIQGAQVNQVFHDVEGFLEHLRQVEKSAAN